MSCCRWSTPLLVLWLVAAAPLAAEAARVRWIIEPELAPNVETTGPPPVRGRLQVKALAAPWATFEVDLEGVMPVELELPEGTWWRLEADVAGYWVPPTEFLVSAVGTVAEPQIIPLWRSAELKARLQLPKGEQETPRVVRLQVTAPADLRARKWPLMATTACSVSPDGVLHCVVPVGTWDLGLRADGFIPLYKFAFSHPDRGSDLGIWRLERGSSVRGFVAVEGGRLSPADCQVRLVPMLGPGDPSPGAAEIATTAVATPVEADGSFQFLGIRSGVYQLEVSQTGWARASLRPIEVLAGRETVLPEAVVLRKPLDLVLTLSPTYDALGQPWRVEVDRTSTGGPDDGGSLFAGLCDDGVVTVRDQAPGMFVFRVFDTEGNRWHREEVRIDSPVEAARSIELGFFPFEGTVHLGAAPLGGAEVYLGGEFGAQRVQVMADSEGQLEGVAPRLGRWHVDVRSSDPELRRRVAVELRAEPGTKARVAIRLSEARISGKVLDPQGQPAAKTNVGCGAAESDLGSSESRTGDDGHFELAGVPLGECHLAAWRTVLGVTESSPPQLLEVTDGRDLGPVELRLTRPVTVHGQVVSPLGTAAGTSLSFWPWEPRLGGGDDARTDLEGRFSARLPQGTRTVLVGVSAPGMALRVFALPVDGNDARLLVRPEGGTVEFELPGPVPSESSFFLFQNGFPILRDDLASWMRSKGSLLDLKQGGVYRAPQLAPGRYDLCVGRDGTLLSEPPPADRRCVSGVLEAGGRLRLGFDGEAETEDPRARIPS